MKYERFRALLLSILPGLMPLAAAEARTSLDLYGPYVSRHEGFRNDPYQCTAGVWTVGVGHKLLPHEAVKTYTNKEIAELFERDLASAVEDARVLLPNFAEQPVSVRKVIVDMAFQLGRPGLKKFSGFLHKVQYRKYKAAQHEILFSKYCDQCVSRASDNIEHLSEVFRNNDK